MSVEARLGYKDPDSVNANLCHREVPLSDELRLHGVLVYEFYKDSAGGLGMNEGYHAGEALARRFIDETGAACLQRIEFTLQVFDFQADVVEGLSAGIKEPGDAGVGADGLDELQVCPADGDEGCQDALIGDFLNGGVRDAEGFLVEARVSAASLTTMATWLMWLAWQTGVESCVIGDP